jgi:DNA (cytosine-5)-methyltransferase 1
MNKLTFGSLFAGIGGFDLGFERAGMECKWQVEIDDYSTKVLEKHWPQVHRERDIRTVGSHNLETVDIICGGFPCQDISYAGLGAGLDGERSGLFFEAIRVVRELQPRVVVLENVAALLTRGLDRVLGTLAEIGYDAEWHCIPAAYVGTHFRRDRLFVIASRSITRCLRRKRFRQSQSRTWGKQQFDGTGGTRNTTLCTRR